MFQSLRMCFSNRFTIHKVNIKVQHSYCHRYTAIAAFLNVYASHGTSSSTAQFLRDGENCCICFADNSLLFSTVKEFSKSVNS